MSDDQQRRWRDAAGYRGDLLRFAHRFAGSREDAEDAVSEAILRAGLTENIDETRMWSWLVAVTKRLCVDQHRRRPRPEHLSRIYAREALDEPPVDEAVCGREEAAWVARHVDLLPDRQRAVLYLRADDVPMPEIAAKLDTSYKTVESLTSRARTSIRAAMAATLVAVFGLVRRASRLAKPAAGAAVPVALALAVTQSVVGPEGADHAAPRLPAPGGPTEVRAPRDSTDRGGSPAAGVTAAGPAVVVEVERRRAGGPESSGASGRPGPGVEVENPAGPDAKATTVYNHTGRDLTEEILYCVHEGPEIKGPIIGCPE